MPHPTLLPRSLVLVLVFAFAIAAATPALAEDAPDETATASDAEDEAAELAEILASTRDGAGRGSPNGSSADPDFIEGLEVSTEPTYGSQEWPVTIGGYLEGTGHHWSKQYFASLLGPNGEPTTYERVGSCCTFAVDDPAILADGVDTGLLDVYEVRVGDAEPVRIYVSIYHTYKIFVPPGFTPRPAPADGAPR